MAGKADPWAPGRRTCLRPSLDQENTCLHLGGGAGGGQRREARPPPPSPPRPTPPQRRQKAGGRAGTRTESLWQESEGHGSSDRTKPQTQHEGPTDGLCPAPRARRWLRPLPRVRPLGFGLCCSTKSVRHSVTYHETHGKEKTTPRPQNQPRECPRAARRCPSPDRTAAPLGRDPRGASVTPARGHLGRSSRDPAEEFRRSL